MRRQVRIPVVSSQLRWGIVLAVAGVIFVTSIVIAPLDAALDPSFAPQDKLYHVLAYGAFGISLAYTFTDRPVAVWKKATTVFVAAVTYGIGIELGQASLPARSLEVGDALANAIGALLSLSWYLVQHRVKFVPADDYR